MKIKWNDLLQPSLICGNNQQCDQIFFLMKKYFKKKNGAVFSVYGDKNTFLKHINKKK